MILLLGSGSDPMLDSVAGALDALEAQYYRLSTEEIPVSIRLAMEVGGGRLTGSFRDESGNSLDLDSLTSVYHRAGFHRFEIYQEYSEQESQFVNQQCLAALNGWLNQADCLVVNRPVAASSNASKPYQIALLEELGMRVPRTLVTNQVQAAREFYEAMGGQVIYKSISYVRSIVQVMKPEDLDRLDSLQFCPIQLQERIAGVDLRVHVVGDALFASRVEAEGSDYRYDLDSVMQAEELSEGLADRCLQVARALDLTLAGIDLRLTPEGEAVCFEVNPSPAFSWFENRTGQPIAASLAGLLCQG